MWGERLTVYGVHNPIEDIKSGIFTSATYGWESQSQNLSFLDITPQIHIETFNGKEGTMWFEVRFWAPHVISNKFLLNVAQNIDH